MISIVSTYKNRRHHLEKTLPLWISQNIGENENYEVVIVDYTSDDDISSLLQQLNSSVEIIHVRCENCYNFLLSHARNVGANYANGDWILYVDIDCMLTNSAIMKLYRLAEDNPKCYFAAVDSHVRKNIINGGLILVSKHKHVEIHGFNENMKGWGFEDIDYKQRLESLGLLWKIIPEDIYECIDHLDDERVRCYDIAKELSWTRNRQISLTTWYSHNYGIWRNVHVRLYGGTQ